MTQYSKTLGSVNSRLYTTLAGQGRVVFSIEEAQTITGTGYPATQQVLLRLSRAGWVVRLGAGKYALVPPSAGDDAFPEASRLVIARELMGDTPYFISYESAMEIHNMLTRPVTRVIVSTSSRKKARTILQIPYQFVTVKPEDLWGYAPQWVSSGEKVQVSDPERTILDGLARPDLCAGVSEVALGLLIRKDELDWEKMASYAHRLGRQVVAKRLGYILEFYRLGSSHVLARLQEMVGSSYALLDPILPAEGRFLSRWRLQLNIDEKSLNGIGST